MCAHALWGCWQLSEDDTHTATLLAAGCMQVTADGLGSRADGVREVCAGLLGNLLRSVAARESALALEPPVLTSLIECIGGRHKALQEAAAGALLRAARRVNDAFGGDSSNPSSSASSITCARFISGKAARTFMELSRNGRSAEGLRM